MSSSSNNSTTGATQDEPYIANQIVSVVIPAGMGPGDSMNIQTDDGRVFVVVIPDGVLAGQALTVEIVEDAHGGSAVVVTEPKPKSNTSANIGAAAVGAVVGTLLIGPITGVVVAGVALYASTRTDSIGKATRATGGAAATAYDKTAEACEKLKVKDKIVSAGKVTYNKAAEINNEYKVGERVTAASAGVVQGAKDLNTKFNITGSAAKLMSSSAKAAASTYSAITGSKGGSSAAATGAGGGTGTA